MAEAITGTSSALQRSPLANYCMFRPCNYKLCKMYLAPPPLVGEVPLVLSECPVRVAVAVVVGDCCNNGDRAPAKSVNMA